MSFHQQPHTFASHVALKVTDLERSLKFYQEIIGFKVLEQVDKKVLLTADGETALLSIEQPENVIPKQPYRTGLYHYALLLPKRSDLAQVVHHLVQHGVRFGSSDHLVSEALYLSDPDGNGIEIYADRPASTWIWQQGEVLMVTEPLDFESLMVEATGEPWRGLPTGTIMGHIHLHVAELQDAEEFYCQCLGFEVVTRYGGQATFMSTGDYHHHIAINTWAGVGAPPADTHGVGMKHFTVVYPSEEARQKVIRKLEELGAKLIEEDGSIYTLDPSGNQIKLTEPVN